MARVHRKVSDQRNDLRHKRTTDLTRENHLICLFEDLNTKGWRSYPAFGMLLGVIYSTSFARSPFIALLVTPNAPSYLFTGSPAR